MAKKEKETKETKEKKTPKQKTILKRLVDFYNQPVASAIINFILANENYVCVNKIYKTLSIEQSICSNALSAMKELKIVSCERKGQFNFYSVNQEILAFVHRVETEARLICYL